MLVVGDREAEAQAAAMLLDDIVAKLVHERDTKALAP
jgi:hypothetical protein